MVMLDRAGGGAARSAPPGGRYRGSGWVRRGGEAAAGLREAEGDLHALGARRRKLVEDAMAQGEDVGLVERFSDGDAVFAHRPAQQAEIRCAACSTICCTVKSKGTSSCCGTSAISRERCLRGIAASDWPSSRTLPELGESVPATMRRSVVLPAPLGPISAAARSFRQCERDVFKHGSAGVLEANVLELEQRLHRGVLPFSFAQEVQKKWAAEEDHEDADRHLGRREERARERVGDDQKMAPGEDGRGQQPHVIGSENHAHDVRHDQPGEG